MVTAEDVAGELLTDAQDALALLVHASGLRIGVISRIHNDRWTAWSVVDRRPEQLAPGTTLLLRDTFCESVHRDGLELALDNAPQDARFAAHAAFLTSGVRSYVGVPFGRHDAALRGTVCAFDTTAHVGTESLLPHFRLMARLLEQQLHLAAVVRDSLSALHREHDTAEARERFLAAVAHDVRSPLATVMMSAKQILATSPHATVVAAVTRILHAARRVARLADDLVDSARGRFGLDIPIERRHVANAALFLREVIADVAAAHPHRRVIADVRVMTEQAVAWDPDRIAQCIGNPLGNACQHGGAGEVVVRGFASGDGWVVSIVNAGELPPGLSIDQPFRSRGRRGLGLGLFIADRIARAHGGSVELRCARGRTVSTLVLPGR